MTNGRIAELALEAQQCIDSTGLEGKELEDYLGGFLKEVVDEAITNRAAPKPKIATRRQRGRRRG